MHKYFRFKIRRGRQTAHACCGMLLLLFFFISCEENEVKNPENSLNTGRHGAFILNEGLFNQGSASLSYIDDEKDTIFNEVFYKQNGFRLGDVGHSMTIIDSLGYIVVNNSGKIEVIDLNSFESIQTIHGFSSPRYLCPVSPTKAYVSDLYENKIHIVDLQSFKITGAVNTGVPVEQMQLYRNEVFALFWSKYTTANESNDKVLVINTEDDSLTDEIKVGIEPNSLVIDKNEQLWVLCSGGFDNEEEPSLFKILPGKRMVLNEYVFPEIDRSPNHLTINHSGDTLYYLNQGVYRMPVNAESLPASAFISSPAALFYTLSVNEDNQLFVGDAKDYQSRGEVMIYNAGGQKMNTYEAGIIPTSIRFR